MATDWVCRYARELGRNKDDATPDYSAIAGFAACHGEEQLRRLAELLKDAAVHAPDMEPEGLRIITTLRRLLEQGSPTPPLKEQAGWRITPIWSYRYTSYAGGVYRLCY